MTERRDSRGRFIKSNVPWNKSRHPVCLQCGCNLIRVNWNRKSDVLVCDNWNCPKYRQPAGNSYDEDEDAKKIKALTENF